MIGIYKYNSSISNINKLTLCNTHKPFSSNDRNEMGCNVGVKNIFSFINYNPIIFICLFRDTTFAVLYSIEYFLVTLCYKEF